jgi:murein DD-endopeptidase MepM/ murein hydrolase activator NlpD
VSGFRTASRPNHDGIDIAAPKGIPIRAAAAGVVIKVRCNASLVGEPYPCDRDGSPSVAGCGWHTEILTERLVHRYCHLLVRPYVHVGQTVTVGQVIGVVGTSGHSSGPHLHWEIHSGSPAASDNAQDPEAFFRSVGVALVACRDCRFSIEMALSHGHGTRVGACASSVRNLRRGVDGSR